MITEIDRLLNLIKTHGRIDERKIPKSLKTKNYERHILILEDRGMIEIEAGWTGNTLIFLKDKPDGHSIFVRELE